MATLKEYSLLIREFHVDSLGHVNNATYLAILEEARWELITQNGYGFKTVQKLRKGPVILEVNLKFAKEIRLRETVKITMEMGAYTGKVGQFTQKIIKEDGSLAAEALFTFGLFDLEQRKLIEPTPEWKQALGLT